MSRLLAALVVLACVAVAAADTSGQDPCLDSASARNATEFAACEAHINAAPFSSDKIVALKECLTTSRRGYTGAQVQSLLGLFSFGGDKLAVLQLLNPYMLGMTCNEVVGVLDTLSFSDARLTALRDIVNVSAIVDLNNKSVIVDAFTFDSDKAEAEKILAKALPRSCLYGQITVKTAVFVVDTSGSMATTFTVDGVEYSRLDYVKKDLSDVISKQLQSWQSFNVVQFSYGTTHLFASPQPTTAANAAAALSFIASWTADGGTNAYGALTAAYSNTGVRGQAAVYFLSDGTPSVGVTNDKEIEDMVASKSQGGSIPCNTVAFVEGNDGSNKQQAMAFMKALATVSNGVTRSMSGN